MGCCQDKWVNSGCHFSCFAIGGPGRCVLNLAFLGFALCIFGIIPLAVASNFENSSSPNFAQFIGAIFLSVGLLLLLGGFTCLVGIAQCAKHPSEEDIPTASGHTAHNAYAVIQPDMYGNTTYIQHSDRIVANVHPSCQPLLPTISSLTSDPTMVRHSPNHLPDHHSFSANPSALGEELPIYTPRNSDHYHHQRDSDSANYSPTLFPSRTPPPPYSEHG